MSDQDLPRGLRDKLERMVRAQREEASVKASHSSSTGFRVRRGRRGRKGRGRRRGKDQIPRRRPA